MTRYTCERCHAVDFTTNPPHLCKDLSKRLARQEKAVALVALALSQWRSEDGVFLYDFEIEDAALAIVKALSGRDLGVE